MIDQLLTTYDFIVEPALKVGHEKKRDKLFSVHFFLCLVTSDSMIYYILFCKYAALPAYQPYQQSLIYKYILIAGISLYTFYICSKRISI